MLGNYMTFGETTNGYGEGFGRPVGSAGSGQAKRLMATRDLELTLKAW
jgi:hypothetical protein